MMMDDIIVYAKNFVIWVSILWSKMKNKVGEREF